MSNLIKLISLWIVLCSAWACGPKMHFTEGKYGDIGIYDSIPYQFTYHKENDAKLLLHLPTMLDSFDFRNSELHDALFAAGYNILTISKPTKADFYLRKSMDYRGQRLKDITDAYRMLKVKGTINPSSLVVLGIGEGAYLAPAVSTALGADSTILVNAGPFSELFELEYLAAKDSLNPVDEAFLERNFQLDSTVKLNEEIEKVKSTGAENFVLGYYQNIYWLSYNQEILSSAYEKMPGGAFWFIFEDYPLFREKNIDYLKTLSAMRKGKAVEHTFLKGDGNLQDPANRQRLQDAILKILESD